MQTVAALLAKVLPKKSAPVQDKLPSYLPNTSVEEQFYRLAVNDNYWRGNLPDDKDGYTLEGAVEVSMRNFRGYSDELRAKILNWQFKHVTTWVLIGWSESRFNEFFAYREELGGTSFQHTNELLNGVHSYYSQLPKANDFTLEPEQVQEQVKALLFVARRLPAVHTAIHVLPEDDDKGIKVISNEGLIQLVMDYPQYAQVMVDTIRERRSVEPDFLRQMITADASAMGSGML